MKKNYIVPVQRCAEIEGRELLMQGSIDNTSYSNKAMVSMGGDGDDPVTDTEFNAKGNGVWDTEW